MEWNSVIIKYNSEKGLTTCNIVDRNTFQAIKKPILLRIISLKVWSKKSVKSIGVLSSNKAGS